MLRLPRCRFVHLPSGVPLAEPYAGGEVTDLKRKLTLTFLAMALGVASAAPVALAAPDFGPGNSSKGPKDPGAKCHPPGQTVTTPGCK
jgi:hypothetical protein